MNADDQLLDALLREQARGRDSDEELLARIERELGASESRARRARRRIWLPVAAAAAVTALAALIFRPPGASDEPALADRADAPAPTAEAPRQAAEAREQLADSLSSKAAPMMAAASEPPSIEPPGSEWLPDVPDLARRSLAARAESDASADHTGAGAPNLNLWRSAGDQPRSAVRLRGDLSGTSRALEAILADGPIAADLVRVEAVINHLRYRYPEPESPVGLIADLASCPWNPGHRLARVALSTRTEGPAIADARLEVRFDSSRVRAYRLLGHSQDSPGTGAPESTALPPKHQVTALYELAPVNPADAEKDTAEWLEASVEFRRGPAAIVERKSARAIGRASPWPDAGPEFRLAAAAAVFAMKIRGIPDVEGISWEDLGKWIDADAGEPESRREFLDLVEQMK